MPSLSKSGSSKVIDQCDGVYSSCVMNSVMLPFNYKCALCTSKGEINHANIHKVEIYLNHRDLFLDDVTEKHLLLWENAFDVLLDTEEQSKANPNRTSVLCSHGHLFLLGIDIKYLFGKIGSKCRDCEVILYQWKQNNHTPGTPSYASSSSNWRGCCQKGVYLCTENGDVSLNGHLQLLRLLSSKRFLKSSLLISSCLSSDGLENLQPRCYLSAFVYAMLLRREHHMKVSGIYLDLSSYIHKVESFCYRLQSFMKLFERIVKEELKRKDRSYPGQKHRVNTFSKRTDVDNDSECRTEDDRYVLETSSDLFLGSCFKQYNFLDDLSLMEIMQDYTEQKMNIGHKTAENFNGEAKEFSTKILKLIKHSCLEKQRMEALSDIDDMGLFKAQITRVKIDQFGNLIMIATGQLHSLEHQNTASTFNLCPRLSSNAYRINIKLEKDLAKSTFVEGASVVLQLCNSDMGKIICREFIDSGLVENLSCDDCFEQFNSNGMRGLFFIVQYRNNVTKHYVSREQYSKRVIHRKELFNSILNQYLALTCLLENICVPPINLKKGEFVHGKSELYHHQLHLNISTFISVVFESMDRCVVPDIEYEHMFKYTSDLMNHVESIQLLFHHPKFRAEYDSLLRRGTRTTTRKGHICLRSEVETQQRITLILPCHMHTLSNVKERSSDTICNSKKVSLYTFQKENDDVLGMLLKQSLQQIESKSLSKNSLLKNSVDLRIGQIETQQLVYPLFRNCLDYTFQQMVAGANQQSSDIMRFEMQRFASFANYNYPDTPNAFELAKAGWYATGIGQETACFICNIKFSEWRKSLKPLDVHVQLSPECPFIKGEDVEAVSVDRTLHQNTSEHSNQNTRRDFESITNGVEQINLTEITNSANNLNPHGFSNNQVSLQQNGHYVNGISNGQPSDISSFQTPIHDQTDHLSNAHQSNGYHLYDRSLLSNGEVSVDNPSRSFANSELLPNSSNGLSPGHSDRHSRIDTGRQYSNNYHHQNNHQFVPFTADLPLQQPLPLNEYYSPPPMSAFGTPKFPAYHALNVRISSYQGFPSHTGQSPRGLAQAGMFYRGYSDRCSCFWCGIGLQNWSIEDDPWVAHARWSPRCQYLIDFKGEEFIALVQESYRQEDPIFPEIDDDDVMIADLQSMGFLTESIQSAIKSLRTNGRNVNLQIVANFLLENMFTEPQAQASAVDVPKDKPPSEFENKAQSNIGKVNNVTSNKNEMSQDKINSLDENSKSMYEETTAMKEQLTCKVCMDNSVSVVFLPCGHIVACAVCSVRLSKCPICRKFIREKVKTLMA